MYNQKPDQGWINHVALVLDESSSMHYLAPNVIQVADNLVSYLAERSQATALDQETRSSVYTFNTEVRCIYYDKDVLRLPSLRDKYSPRGYTALIDATLKTLDDLSQTAQLYGDHAFLLYLITDGEENSSRASSNTLSQRLSSLPDNYTVAVFTPNQNGVHEAKKFGFPPQNISLWDTTTRGLSEVGEIIRKTTDTFMQARPSGVRGSRSIFQLDLSNLTSTTVETKLQKLLPSQYEIYEIPSAWDRAQISEFVDQKTPYAYRKGMAYYQLTKSEIVQANKQIYVYDTTDGSVYGGSAARQLLRLPNTEVRIKPEDHPRYQLFIQSTSVNRKLVAGTKLLVVN